MRHDDPRRVERWLSLAVPALAGVAILASGSLGLAAAVSIAARIAYVTFVGVSLAREDARPRNGLGAALLRWAAFRRRVAWLMTADAVALGALSLVTRDSLAAPSRAVAIAVGAALFVLGVAIKRWAAASLPPGSYTWRDFFVPEAAAAVPRGPYRWLSNPMYTVGYAHAYGFALATRSLWGLCAAAFAQALILAMHFLVERPHVKRRERAPRSETTPAYP